MNIKDSLKFGVMIGLLEVHKVVVIYVDDIPLYVDDIFVDNIMMLL